MVDEHVRWLLGLEREHVVVMSGPLLSGPGTGPGSGVTVLRAAGAAEAARPSPRGTRSCGPGCAPLPCYRWRVNEGSIGIQLLCWARSWHLRRTAE